MVSAVRSSITKRLASWQPTTSSVDVSFPAIYSGSRSLDMSVAGLRNEPGMLAVAASKLSIFTFSWVWVGTVSYS